MRDVLTVAAIGAVVVGAMLLPIDRPGLSLFAFDVYAYFYVNVLYALRALDAGGRGLLWNPLQSCGQPFFANGTTGMLYPPNWLFIALGPDAGLATVAVVNQLIGAIGAYGLARQLRLGAAAAIAGALAFSLGNAAVYLSAWSPVHGGTYVWFPAAMLCCERVLQRVTFGRVVALAVVMTIALLPGFPQIVLFMYFAIVLRVLWALLGQECAQPLRTLAGVLGALGLPLLLGAVQLFPSLEFARESIRSLPLASSEPLPGTSWSILREGLLRRRASAGPFLPVTLGLVAAALAGHRERGRLAVFYALLAVLFLGLAFGPGQTVLRAPYELLPFGSVLRRPERFLWAFELCWSVLVAFGVDVLAGPLLPRRRAIATALMMGVTVLVALLFPGGLTRWETVALLPLGIAGLALVFQRLAPLIGPALALGILLNVTVAPFGWVMQRLPSNAPLFAHAVELATVRAQLTPQDRVALVNSNEFTFMRKTATVLQFPAIFDYEPQTSRRYADYFTMLRRGDPVATFRDVYDVHSSWFSAQASRRLLDLTAARFLVADPSLDTLSSVFSTPPIKRISLPSAPGVRSPLHAYENNSALPRAFYVPRIALIADPRQLLRRIASGPESLREVAFVETLPASRFIGAAALPAPATVSFETDLPEHLVLRVQAPRRGFLFLADQYYPGWRARVNGRPAEILRANYVFRLVEVPAGESVVEFRFRPPTVLVGAAVSLVTVLALAAAGLWRRRRTRADAPAAVRS